MRAPVIRTQSAPLTSPLSPSPSPDSATSAISATTPSATSNVVPTTLPHTPPANETSPLRKNAKDLLEKILVRSHGGDIDTTNDHTWLSVDLSENQYQALQDSIAADQYLSGWAEDKLRYDWDPPASPGGLGHYILRMPSATHDYFCYKLQKRIAQEIEGIGKRAEEEGHLARAQLANSVDALGTSTVPVGHRGKKSPDHWFVFGLSAKPTVVIKIANSQKSEDLPILAHNYLRDGARAVIAVDLEYRSPKDRGNLALQQASATYSVYRKEVYVDGQGRERARLSQNCEHRPFRNPRDWEGSLELQLSDFCPQPSLTGDDDVKISIPHQALSGILDVAEAYQQSLDNAEPDSSDPSPALEWDSPPKRAHGSEEEESEDSSSSANTQKDPDYKLSPPHSGKRQKT